MISARYHATCHVPSIYSYSVEHARRYRHFRSSFQSSRTQTSSSPKLSVVFPLLGSFHNRFFSIFFFSPVNPPDVARISGRQITELLRDKDENVFLLGRGVDSLSSPSKSDAENEEEESRLLLFPSIFFLLGLGESTPAKSFSLFHLVIVSSTGKLQEESGL